jgi:light-harvesting protein B-800-850 alpha chain
MNQGRIWTVVNPSVGLPLFLGSVAVMSFTVHLAVLNHSSWYKEFFNGTGMGMAKAASAETLVAPDADLASVAKSELAIEVAQAPAIEGDDSTSIILKIKPKDPVADPS